MTKIIKKNAETPAPSVSPTEEGSEGSVTQALRKLDTTEVAKIAHEVNRAYCVSIGDDSQVSWEEAPDWQLESAIKGVVFHLENPDAGPAASHESWLAEKTEKGWKYGTKKDVVLKTHPCFVPYEKLPKRQQAKDALFISVVRACEGFM